MEHCTLSGRRNAATPHLYTLVMTDIRPIQKTLSKSSANHFILYMDVELQALGDVHIHIVFNHSCKEGSL